MFHGKVVPERAFTAEMSEELMLPDAFTSNWKLSAVVACPDRAFTALMSLEFTDRELFTSPTRNPSAADALAVPFTPVTETLTRLPFATLERLTVTSSLRNDGVFTTDAPVLSTTVTAPIDVTA